MIKTISIMTSLVYEIQIGTSLTAIFSIVKLISFSVSYTDVISKYNSLYAEKVM